MSRKTFSVFAMLTLAVGIFAFLLLPAFAAPQDRTTSLGITNQPPAFASGPSDNGSDGTSPTDVGVNVTFSATAKDPNGDNYYVAVCKTAAITPGAGAAPTCDGESWGNVTASTVSDIPITPIAYTALVGDAESNDWFAYVCDGNGAGGSGDPDHQCSAVSNSESPFNVNHAPTFGTVLVGSATGGTGDIVPGSTVYFHLDANGGANGIDDNDSDTTPDTVRTYICDSATTGMSTPGTCAEGTLICSQGTPFDPNTVPFECSNATIAAIPTAHDSYDFKVFVFDSHGFAGTGTASQSYAVQDVAPTVDTYTVNDIHPTAGGSVFTSFTVLVSDDNGWGDIDTVDGLIYDSSGAGNGGTTLSSGTCAPSERNCYLRAACSKANSTATQLIATCDAIETFFNINPTTPGVWKAHANAIDGGGTPRTVIGADSSTDIAVGALSAVAVTQTSIAYGGIVVGGTSASSQPTTLQNVGNIQIDVGIHGTNMMSGGDSIPLAQQRWATDTGFSYGTSDHPLVADPETVPGSADTGCANRSVAVRASHGSTATDSGIFWKLQIPDPQPTGSYAGTNTFTSIVDGLCTGSDGAASGDVCGDGILTGAETCDDGSTVPGDGCSAVCATESNYTCYGTPSTCHPTVQIGTQNWFARNLNVGTMIVNDVPQADNSEPEKYCYDNNEANCDIYGGLYQWDEIMGYVETEGAQGICPAGWHVPTVFDWNTLVTYLGGSSAAGGAMKEAGTDHWNDPNVADNSSGFTALGAGYGDASGFYYLGDFGTLWTSKPNAGLDAWATYFFNTGADIYIGPWGGRQYGLSVRCIQDPTPGCGNNFIDPGETCDDGNATAGDGCSDVCATEAGYSCVGLPSVCEICGNGVIGSSETCDDNNIIPGDGCSAVCATESGYTCVGEPSVCADINECEIPTEICDYDGYGQSYNCRPGVPTHSDAICGSNSACSNTPAGSYTCACGTGYSGDSTGKNCAFINFRVTTPIGANDDTAQSVALQSDGKIVAAGYDGVDFALARYTTTGALDTSFDTDGKVTTPIGSSNDYAQSVAIYSGGPNVGKIVVAGSSYIGGHSIFALVRYNTNGSLDTDFDTDGIVTTAIESGNSGILSIAIDADWKIVAAGNAYTSSPYSSDFALARYNADGSLDTTFSVDGKLTTAIGSGDEDDYANSVAIDADGKIVAAGTSDTNPGFDPPVENDFALVRYNADGTLDTNFSGDGKVTTDIGSIWNTAKSVAIDADGKIVVAGYNYDTGTYSSDFALARYSTTGALDGTFGSGGIVTTDIGEIDQLTDIAIQADGMIVGAGQIYNDVTFNSDFGLVRYTTAGALDGTFGSGGIVMTAIGTGADEAQSVAIQTDGKIVAAGRSSIDWNDDFALVRYTTTGAVDER